jgi:hypothetical protein
MRAESFRFAADGGVTTAAAGLMRQADPVDAALPKF